MGRGGDSFYKGPKGGGGDSKVPRSNPPPLILFKPQRASDFTRNRTIGAFIFFDDGVNVDQIADFFMNLVQRRIIVTSAL